MGNVASADSETGVVIDPADMVSLFICMLLCNTCCSYSVSQKCPKFDWL